jgi:hypothetical protein
MSTAPTAGPSVIRAQAMTPAAYAEVITATGA